MLKSPGTPDHHAPESPTFPAALQRIAPSVMTVSTIA